MRKLLHVMNGDSTRLTFEQSGMPGAVTVFADALLEGPVPEGLTDTEMGLVRERFWTDGAPPRMRRSAAAADSPGRGQQGLEAYPQYEEVVLWFEHDLFDQLLLIRHLDWFDRHGLGATRLSLICIDRFPGIERFKGLGQLTPDQLRSLLDSRQTVTVPQFEIGRRAWQAFTSSDPARVAALLESGTGALPFLAPALHRWLEEFPATGSGLPRSEREILDVLSEGPRSMWSLFHAAARREAFLTPTDISFASRIEALASGSRPLVDLRLDSGPTRGMPNPSVTITGTGSEVLAGRLDWLSLTPFDRWLGGVHVTNGSIWRWDATNRCVRRESRGV